MSQDRRLLEHQLDRVERMLELCIEADKAARKQQRVLKRQKKREEEKREGSDPLDDEPTH